MNSTTSPKAPIRLLVGGNNGFFAFGLNILPNNPNNKGEIGNRISATAFQNRTTINTDWIKYYSPQVNFRVFGAYRTNQGPDAPAALFGFEGLARNLPASVAATSLSSRPVSRLADGRLVGRIHQMNSLKRPTGRCPIDESYALSGRHRRRFNDHGQLRHFRF